MPSPRPTETPEASKASETSPSRSRRSPLALLAALGPGVLFTGAAVGVSHLVQSTRAGAGYGLALVGVVVLANLMKYPAFRFGPLYASATGTSLLEGYRRRGRWALGLYAVVTLGTMFTVQAGVTVVTAGLVRAVFGLSASPLTISAGLLLGCGLLAGTGGYRWLGRIGKIVVAVLAGSTVVATALVLPDLDFGTLAALPDLGALSVADWAFMAALAGWMPSAIDVAVWQSLWGLAQRGEADAGSGGADKPSGGPGPDEDAAPVDPAEAESFDFHVGYVGTAALALCFVALGAAVFHREGVTLEQAPGAFAAQLIDVYAQTLGEWSRPVIGLAALATMVSTTLTVLDGFPRAISVFFARLRSPEQPGEVAAGEGGRVYLIAMVTLALGALAILALLATRMRTLIDIATTLSFLSAPALAYLNHRAVTAEEMPEARRPRRWLVRWSVVAIVAQAGFAAAYLALLVG